ncbi:MAG TPA: phosphotransferase [Pseudonocardiaceae bacterium]
MESWLSVDGHADVPALVRQKALSRGEAGRQWLAELPDLLADLRQEWSLTLLDPLTGGSAAYVVRVRTADHQDAVVKLPIPGDDIAGQVRTIRDANGHGYVTLLAHDEQRRAILLESLGPSLERLGWPPERMIEVLADTLRQAWQVPAHTVAAQRERAAALAQFVEELWATLDHPCDERVVTQALRYAKRRSAAFDPDRCVVVHGDPHPGNALRVTTPRVGAESGFVFVDPDGFLADPAYDCGVVQRDWCTELLAGDPVSLARKYCALLADHTGIDATAIWEWGFLERVSTGLYALSFGAEDMGGRFLRTAELLV